MFLWVYSDIGNHDHLISLNIVCPLQEKYYGREIILADRDMVEQSSGKYQICIGMEKIIWS